MPTEITNKTVSPILVDLNPEQQEAAQIIDGPVLILAGAGSGKTKTLTHRIAYLVSKGVKPWNILSVTFTNKAAGEMRDRAERLLATRPDLPVVLASGYGEVAEADAQRVGIRRFLNKPLKIQELGIVLAASDDPHLGALRLDPLDLVARHELGHRHDTAHLRRRRGKGFDHLAARSIGKSAWATGGIPRPERSRPDRLLGGAGF